MVDSNSSGARPEGLFARLLRNLRPSHQHSAFSATLLLMSSVMLGRIIGYLREMYVAWAFGAGPKTDAYVAAFTLPDFLFYILAGGTASITFISIYTRQISQKRDHEAQEAFNSTITIMTLVIIFGTILVEIFTPQFERLLFPHFTAEQMQLCVYLTRILLPGQIFFYAGGVVSAVLLSRRMFLYPALSPVIYGASIILGGLIGAHRFGITALAYGALAGSFIGPFLINAIGAANAGLGYRLNFNWRNQEFREWVRLNYSADAGRVAGFGGRLDSALLRVRRRRRHYTPQLCQAIVCAADFDYRPGSRAGLDAVFCQIVRRGPPRRIRRQRQQIGVSHLGRLPAGDRADDSRRAALCRPRLPSRPLYFWRLALHLGVLCLVLGIVGSMVGAGPLFTRILRRRQHAHSDDRQQRYHGCVIAYLRVTVSQV